MHVRVDPVPAEGQGLPSVLQEPSGNCPPRNMGPCANCGCEHSLFTGAPDHHAPSARGCCVFTLVWARQ